MAELTRKTDRSALGAVDDAIGRSQDYLFAVQFPEGYWWDELESNPTMEAEYLMLTYFLEVEDKERWRKLANSILGRQSDDGSWGQYYEAPGDLSTSVECYFALKLAGVSADLPEMKRAKRFILSKGGVPKVRIFTKIWLSLFGQWEWKGTPTMPPEIVLLPTWLPLNIYRFSSWARATIVPMTLILDQKPCKPPPEWAAIDELYPHPRELTDYSLPKPKSLLSVRRMMLMVDLALRVYNALPFKPGRALAIRKAMEWIVSRQETDGSWGGIQPPWVYSLIALKHMGFSMDHPVMRKGLEGFEGFSIEDEDTWRVQACISPVWDTCLVSIGLLESGVPPDHPALRKAALWMLDQQVSSGGDWQVNVKGVEPGGWAFEFANDTYPDVDDAAEVLMALNDTRLDPQSESKKAESIRKGVDWVLGMQCSNGGWAAFDKDNDAEFVAKIPFSDFGETLDPPSVDVSAHVLEALGKLGYSKDFPAVLRGYEYIRSEQEPDGPWFGRWGVNYVYGTGAVLPALEAIGERMDRPYVRKAVNWLLEHQNPDGGWGESCASYVDPQWRGRGASTASQTSWALLALISAGEVGNPATERGVKYLTSTQRKDGTWNEPYFTGAGFPGYGVGKRLARYPKPGEDDYQGADMPTGFMINYHMYRNSWPLTALGRYRQRA